MPSTSSQSHRWAAATVSKRTRRRTISGPRHLLGCNCCYFSPSSSSATLLLIIFLVMLLGFLQFDVWRKLSHIDGDNAFSETYSLLTSSKQAFVSSSIKRSKLKPTSMQSLVEKDASKKRSSNKAAALFSNTDAKLTEQRDAFPSWDSNEHIQSHPLTSSDAENNNDDNIDDDNTDDDNTDADDNDDDEKPEVQENSESLDEIIMLRKLPLFFSHDERTDIEDTDDETNDDDATDDNIDGGEMTTNGQPGSSMTISSSDTHYYKLGLVRAIGNALPPRHDANQTLRNLEFILKYEPNFEQLHKHWVFNRIVDKDLLQRLLNLLQRYNQTSYTIIPFVLKEYAKKQYQFRKGHYQDELDMIHNKSFYIDKWSDNDRARYFDIIQDQKNLYVTNQNNARNVAMEWYMLPNRTVPEVDYVLPWDGNCFLTHAAFVKLQQDLIRWNLDPVAAYNATSRGGSFSQTNLKIRSLMKEPLKYFYTPMDRLLVGNEVLLDPNYLPRLNEEPQIIFHRTAVGRFDPTLRYGKKNKVEMLLRLRIKGPWDVYAKDLADVRDKTFSDWIGPPPAAGWVSRLFSGKSRLEKKNTSPQRVKARTDGMTRMLQRLDLQVATKLHGWNSSTWMFYDQGILAKEAEFWANSKQLNGTGPFADSNSSLYNLIQNLVAHADHSLHAGPWSVMDKKPCGCGKYNDCHDYYSVIGHKITSVNTSINLPMCASDAMRHDRSRLEAFQYNTTILALAYSITRNNSYVEKAAENILTWFVNPKTRMNPRLGVEWQSGGNQNFITKYGVIEFKDLYYFLDALRIVEKSGVWTQAQTKDVILWFQQYLEWLLVSKDKHSRRGGLKAYFEANHHGLYHDIQVISVASFVGNLTIALTTMHESVSRLLTQISAKGELRKELGLSNCEHWQAFTLQGWFTLARMAKKAGVNLWNKLRAPSHPDLGTTEPQSALCRAAEYTIPLLRLRPTCNGSYVYRGEDVSRWFPLYLEVQHHCSNAVVRYPGFLWPDWWPLNSLPESPPGDAYQMKPLHSHGTAIAPFWNLGLYEYDISMLNNQQ
ncbi:alginate lyase-domain containing protein [Nitzschia inconspicua]|uniref:Alginate lyase-domain containing protein n=1 Tax=Nitzschia inconspicua TaxID=303405 RepID=A0A9K3LWD9_9STRA|nr:alginate lyase-domain containing protein [Nitzschia inconspicua]